MKRKLRLRSPIYRTGVSPKKALAAGAGLQDKQNYLNFVISAVDTGAFAAMLKKQLPPGGASV